MNLNLIFRNQTLILEGQSAIHRLTEHHGNRWQKGGCWRCRFSPLLVCSQQKDTIDELNRITEELTALTAYVAAGEPPPMPTQPVDPQRIDKS